jgi:hypothetical protein
MVRETHPTLIFIALGVHLEHEGLVPKSEWSTKDKTCPLSTLATGDGRKMDMVYNLLLKL